MPTMAELLLLSKENSYYMWCLSVFLKHGAGGKTWNKLHLRQPISKFVTSSTEAIVLLILENNYDRWMDEAENPTKEKKELVPALYTNSGISQRGGRATSRKGGGWSTEGILRFNALVSCVRHDRKNRGGFEVALMNQMITDNTVKAWQNQKQKTTDHEEVEEVVAFNDFDEAEQNDNEDDDEAVGV